MRKPAVVKGGKNVGRWQNVEKTSNALKVAELWLIEKFAIHSLKKEKTQEVDDERHDPCCSSH